MMEKTQLHVMISLLSLFLGACAHRDGRMIDLGIPEPRRLTLSIGESVVIDEYKLEITAKNLERDNYVCIGAG